MPTLNEEIVEEVRKRSASPECLPGIRMVAISLGYTFVELDKQTMGVCSTPDPTVNLADTTSEPEHWQKNIS
jgi:uncharacterized protein